MMNKARTSSFECNLQNMNERIKVELEHHDPNRDLWYTIRKQIYEVFRKKQGGKIWAYNDYVNLLPSFFQQSMNDGTEYCLVYGRGL